MINIRSRNDDHEVDIRFPKEMCDRIHDSGDYYKALGIIGEYVNITSVDDAQSEGEDFEEGMGMQL